MIHSIFSFSYFGELSAFLAALCWSIAVIIFKSASNELSPLLITALKNTIALMCFFIVFILFDIPIWYSGFENIDYIKIIISGCLGMGIADILFITALSKIGANRVAIINCFEPAVIYCFSTLILGTILTLQQLIGFSIVIISILVISYEKDKIEINRKFKLEGIMIQISAVLLSSFGIVLIKPLLSTINHSITLQIWVTVFRLVPGFLLSWIIFMFTSNKLYSLKPLNKSILMWKILISSGLGTFMALSFWIIGYANIEKPPIASIIGQSSTIFVLILSYFILKENITKFRIAAMFLACFGVILIIIK